jgi:hypothetical protein
MAVATTMAVTVVAPGAAVAAPVLTEPRTSTTVA